MVALNFTLVVQLLLFLLFLYVTNKIVMRPLLKTMDARAAKVEGDRALANADGKKAEQIENTLKDQLTGIHQEEALRLRKARLDEYNKNRGILEEMRRRIDSDVDAYRVQMDLQVDKERLVYPSLVPAIIEAMDRQINADAPPAEGSAS
jgi:F0F1-type ATP synthase membrane subunit b/b'